MPASQPHFFLAKRKPDLDQGLVEEEFALITVERLQEPRYWDRLYATVLAFDDVHEVGLATKLWRKLNTFLDTPASHPLLILENQQRLQQVVRLLKVVALPALHLRDLEETCRTSFVFALRAGLNLKEGIIEAFLFTGEPELAVRLSQTITRVMGENSERVGVDALLLPATGERLESTVRNWLRVYNSAFPVEVERGPVERAQFLQSDKNVQHLPSEERQILVQLLEVYDLLRFPHKAPISEVGETEVIQDEPISRTARASALQRAMSSVTSMERRSDEIYQTLATMGLQSASVVETLRRLSEIVGRDHLRLLAVLSTALKARDVSQSLAALQLLVTRNEFLLMLERDKTLRQHFLDSLSKRLSPAVIQSFLSHPASRQSVQMYVQYVLQELLKLSESDAARIGVQLGNLFRQHGHPELSALAYYDVKGKTFKWLE